MAMKCQQIIDLLVEYIDGDLGPDKTRRLETHLDDCPPCVNFVETYRRTGTVCRRALSSVEMPGAVESTLFEFLRTELQSTKP